MKKLLLPLFVSFALSCGERLCTTLGCDHGLNLAFKTTDGSAIADGEYKLTVDLDGMKSECAVVIQERSLFDQCDSTLLIPLAADPLLFRVDVFQRPMNASVKLERDQTELVSGTLLSPQLRMEAKKQNDDACDLDCPQSDFELMLP